MVFKSFLKLILQLMLDLGDFLISGKVRILLQCVQEGKAIMANSIFLTLLSGLSLNKLSKKLQEFLKIRLISI